MNSILRFLFLAYQRALGLSAKLKNNADNIYDIDLGGESYYITNGESLPAPLPRDEERLLTERLSSGDMEARNTLIEHNLRLVVYIAKKFENTGIGIDELVAAGLTNGKELVKILGMGQLTVKVDVEAHAFSKTAEEAIKAQGGNTTIIE